MTPLVDSNVLLDVVTDDPTWGSWSSTTLAGVADDSILVINALIYTIALSQAWHHEPARAYIARKRASGKSWAEALCCLKHRVAGPVVRLLQAGQMDWARHCEMAGL